MTNASTPHTSASGTPRIIRATVSITATMRPKTVETIQYDFTPSVNDPRASASRGRCRAITARRLVMPGTSNTRNVSAMTKTVS